MPGPPDTASAALARHPRPARATAAPHHQDLPRRGPGGRHPGGLGVVVLTVRGRREEPEVGGGSRRASGEPRRAAGGAAVGAPRRDRGEVGGVGAARRLRGRGGALPAGSVVVSGADAGRKLENDFVQDA